ncbi:MAG: sensor histidine kinase [Desulfuromonas sp.]|uniref:ATP-binding protein n=1 Tax=Desulfuromonas sp. TaxID=892 RepID=UPI000CBC2D31|nr:sensor histidine kinase [Desulfuromonas sp.]PLX84558.1 MAG: sensor histidine kinase [Desulfuromonas sp.]
MASRIRKTLSSCLPRTIQSQMILLVSAVVLVQIVVSGIIFASLVGNILTVQIGRRALDIAGTVSAMPEVRRAVEGGDPAGIVQEIAEAIRGNTGAEFVVVGDRTGRRLSHPDPAKIGRFFVGGDIGPALREGKAYVSRAVGTLGPSLRGIVPVRGESGAVAGFVAVGYLTEDVEKTVRAQQREPRVFVFMMILIGLLSAVLIAKYFKRAILGLEPAEIASLYQERGAILESIREGVVAIDGEGAVRLANRAALNYTGLDPALPVVGRPVEEILPGADMERLLKTGAEEYDRELVVGGKEMVFNMVPVFHQEQVMGIVASFRRKDELERLARELAQTREYTEMLRVQAHEYSNKLHTIAGLLQLEAYTEALELILTESSGHQELIQLLGEAVPHPVVSGLIIGKYNRARELKIAFDIDRQSSMRDIPSRIGQEKIVTILGNLIDNALEAIRDSANPQGSLKLSMTDIGDDLIFEVEDSGRGVDPEIADRIFAKGVSTKGAGKRGVGLYLVANALEELGGEVTVSGGELGGALFTVMIPKGKADEE